VSIYSQTAILPLAACVSHAHAVVTFPRCCRETLTTRDRQTAGFSVRELLRRHGTDRRTDARPLHTPSARRSQRQKSQLTTPTVTSGFNCSTKYSKMLIWNELYGLLSPISGSREHASDCRLYARQ